MKIQIAAIPDEGQSFTLNPSDLWVRELVAQALPKESPDLKSLNCQVTINRVDKYLNLSGTFKINLHVSCDRCLRDITVPLAIPLKMHLSPMYNSERDRERAERQGEDIELDAQDLEFNFYKGSELDVAEIIREEVVLELPTGFLCSPDCKGLCPSCGANLNQTICGCAEKKPVDPRWNALKELKLPSK